MSKKREISQPDQVLEHCLKKGKITHIEAMRLYGIESLSSQISRLKKEGYEFSKKDTTFQKDGNTYHNVVYTLVNHDKDEAQKEDTVLIEIPKELKSVVIIPNVDSDVKTIKVFKDDKGAYQYELKR